MRQSRRRQQAGPEQPASWLPWSCHAVMPASWDLAASELASEIPRAVCLFVMFFYAARSCRRLSLRFASLRFFLSRRCFSLRPARVFGASSHFLLLLGSLMCCAACNSEARRWTVPPSRSTRRLSWRLARTPCEHPTRVAPCCYLRTQLLQQLQQRRPGTRPAAGPGPPQAHPQPPAALCLTALG